ncbi:FtsB family cell division protein [Calditrichota bacterium LG25]
MKTKKRKRNKTTPKNILKILIGFFIFAVIYLLFFSGPRSVIQYFRQTTYKKSLQKEIQSLKNEKQSLKKEAERLKNDLDYIEKIAREKYNMKKKDEKVYKIIKEK